MVADATDELQRKLVTQNKLYGAARGFTLIWFVWFDSLRPINNLSVKQGQVFLRLKPVLS